LFRSSTPDSSHLNFGFPTRRVSSFLRTVSFLQGPQFLHSKVVS
jgi:hypothetical protein